MTSFERFSTLLAVVFLMVGFGTVASAQEVTPGQTEVLGYVGGVTDGGGFTVGGGIQYAFTPRWLFAGEVGYLTGDGDVEVVFPPPFPGGVDVESSAISVDANAHYLFPRPTQPKLTPYALGGLGIMRVSASMTAFGVTSSLSDTEIGLNIGGGLRWQARERLDVRPELKVFVADNSSVRFSVALYYQLRQ